MSSDPVGQGPTPAARLLMLVLMVTAIATAPLGRRALVATAIAAAVVVCVARPALRWLATRAALASLAIASVVLPWALSGQWHHAGLLAGRGLGCAVVALSVASTLEAHELSSALRALGASEAFTRVIASMLRQLTGLVEEGRRTVLARRLRGATGVQVGPEVLAALFDRTAVRADRVQLAERLRGDSLGPTPSWASLRGRDLPWLAMAALVSALPQAAARIAS